MCGWAMGIAHFLLITNQLMDEPMDGIMDRFGDLQRNVKMCHDDRIPLTVYLLQLEQNLLNDILITSSPMTIYGWQ